MKLTIKFDGGSVPNPGQMYGSYSIEQYGCEIHRASRIPFGLGTNNVAEFTALIHALDKAADILHGQTASLLILTDSTIVRNRINGKMKNTPQKMAKLERKYGPKAVESAKRMDELAQRALRLIIRHFPNHEIRWQPRECNVQNFGH